jgi:hypothetical protein
MTKKYFTLGIAEAGKLGKILLLIFGTACIIVAILWIIISLGSVKTESTLWITIVFLAVFGIYQILSGLGKTTRFIEIGDQSIRLKKNSVLPPTEIMAADMDKIEIYPMSMIFILKAKKRITLRFGAIYQDTNELIKDEMISFAGNNNIRLEFIEEKI